LGPGFVKNHLRWFWGILTICAYYMAPVSLKWYILKEIKLDLLCLATYFSLSHARLLPSGPALVSSSESRPWCKHLVRIISPTMHFSWEPLRGITFYFFAPLPGLQDISVFIKKASTWLWVDYNLFISLVSSASRENPFENRSSKKYICKCNMYEPCGQKILFLLLISLPFTSTQNKLFDNLLSLIAFHTHILLYFLWNKN